MRHFYCVTFLLLAIRAMTANAQTEVRAETQLSVSSGSHTPLWLNANKYGLSSLNNTNGYFRAGIFKSLQADSARRWAIGYGADMALAGGYTSTTVVQQAYVDVRWLKGLLTIGSKEQPMQLKSQWLSTGSQTLGINARPVPGIRISLPEYWEVPYTKRWVALKGHVAYGMMTDDNWQKDFTHEKTRHVEHAKLHTKAGYLRIGKEGKPISVEMGLEMACQFGGTTYMDTGNGMMKIENEDGLKSMLRAFIPGGNDANEEIYKNKEGNHLGSYLLRINMDFDKWYLGVYADHYFEDHSQMFFVDYNGYGQGEDYNKWVDKRWFVYDVKDIMMGAELKLKEQKWVNNIVVEYLYTKYQSGAIYHDRTRHISDHIAGRDEYYNHFYHTGWQHWGQVMGNPLYRSPLYNDDGNIRVADNRFWAWHLALSGTPATELSYRLMATWQRGWGTYNYPLPDPERNMSLMAEARYAFGDAHPLAGWELKAAIGIDHGELLGNNIGTQITIGKRLNIDKKK